MGISILAITYFSINPPTANAISDAQIKQKAFKACNTKNANSPCVKGYIAGYNGDNINCAPSLSTFLSAKQACLKGERLGQNAAIIDSTPPISECNKADNKTDVQKCKKEYRKCDKPPYSLQKIKDCKQAAIDKYTKKNNGSGSTHNVAPPTGTKPYQCGNLPNQDANVKTNINFGCLGDKGPSGLGPIQDLVFALIRFLSVGVGVVITISLIAAGIQYSMAEGNPESSQKAKQRVQNTVIGLAIYIFAFSILQYLIPGGLFLPGLWLDRHMFINELGAL